MNTTENNKLIAEFMGLNLYQQNWYKSTIATEKKICKENKLKYHSDWNWLMEVVEKIEDKNFPNEGKGCVSFLVKITNHNCQIVDLFKDRFDINIYGITKIEAVYNACISFIEWYNSAQKR